MPIVPPPPGQERIEFPQIPSPPAWVWAALAVPALIILLVCYWWFIVRVEVGPGKVLVLVNKWGRTLPAMDGPAPSAEQVVLYPELLAALGEPADSLKYKGIVYEVLPEGRHFKDPFFYERIIKDAIFVEQKEIGVKVRKFGRALPPGKLVATEPDERGPLAEVLRQGRHNINPFAYDVLKFEPKRIQEGHVGVQTLFSGEDPENPNTYVVQSDERGVQPDVLPPGMYFNNPFVRKIDEVEVRSHTLDLRDDEAIRFPSNDSFEIVIEGTVEYAIRQDRAPYVLTAIGNHQDVESKLIQPYANSLSRIEGSKLLARDFISGESRKAFQDRVFEGLRQQCFEQGIEIRAVLFRRIEAPPAIAGPISERQVAEQQINQYQNEIQVAKSEAQLVEQQEMLKQNKAIGEAQRDVVGVIKEAEQRKAVALTEANKRLEVAALALDAARESAAAIKSRGDAEAQVILLDYTAQADPLQEAVLAFGGGDAYAQYYYLQRLGPALKSVLASTDGPIADVFRALSPSEIKATPFSAPRRTREAEPTAPTTNSEQLSRRNEVEGN